MTIKIGDKVIRHISAKKIPLRVEEIKDTKEFGKTVRFYRLKTPSGYSYLVDEHHFKLNYRKAK